MCNENFHAFYFPSPISILRFKVLQYFLMQANLVDIFISLSTVDDSLYSLCQLKEFKFLADMVEHIKIPLKVK